MIYQIECQDCGPLDVERPMSHPAKDGSRCPACQGTDTVRLWTMPSICTVGCSGASDPNDIPLGSRVHGSAERDILPAEGARIEKAYAQHIQNLRRSQKPGKLRMTHSVPAELYHGKIRQTGDKQYWDDPKNQARHKDFEV